MSAAHALRSTEPRSRLSSVWGSFVPSATVAANTQRPRARCRTNPAHGTPCRAYDRAMTYVSEDRIALPSRTRGPSDTIQIP